MHEQATPPLASVGTGAKPRREEAVAWLRVGSAREVLGRIVPEDCLGLRERVACRLREEALFLPVDRVLLRAFALTARAAVSWRGRPKLDVWLARRVDEALAHVREEEERALATGPPAEGDHESVLGLLAPPLGLEPGAVREACTRFNRLERDERRAFFELYFERSAPDAPLDPVLARRAWRVLLRSGSPPSLPPSPPCRVTAP